MVPAMRGAGRPVGVARGLGVGVGVVARLGVALDGVARGVGDGVGATEGATGGVPSAQPASTPAAAPAEASRKLRRETMPRLSLACLRSPAQQRHSLTGGDCGPALKLRGTDEGPDTYRANTPLLWVGIAGNVVLLAYVIIDDPGSLLWSGVCSLWAWCFLAEYLLASETGRRGAKRGDPATLDGEA